MIGGKLNKKDIFEEMIYDEDVELNKLVNKAKSIVLIRKSTGKPVLLHKDKLSDAENIGCFILGCYFSKEAGFIDSDVVSIDDIALGLGMQKTSVSARIKDLKDSEIVECVSRGNYKISSLNLEKYLDKIIRKVRNS